MILETIDIMVIAETKIDNTLPTSQFMIEGFMKPFRYDRNQNGGGLLIYVREPVPVKELIQYRAPKDICLYLYQLRNSYNTEPVPVKELIQYRAPKECGMIEINLKKQKLLMVAIFVLLLSHNSISLVKLVKCLITIVASTKV